MEIKPIDITDNALQAINNIITAKQIPDGYGLRIGMADRNISCGATNYTLGFDKKTDRDVTYTLQNLEVIIKKTDAVHLAGIILDYVTENEVTGFSFSREN